MAMQGAMQRTAPSGVKKDKNLRPLKPNGSPQVVSSRERGISFEDNLSQSIGSDGIKIGLGYEGDHIRMLRDRYNASKLRSEELSLTSTSLPVPLRVHGELAGRVYSAMATLLYASISISKIDDLERYIRKKATQLPRTIFDLDDWATVLNIARECRSTVPMPQIVKISDNDGYKKIKVLEDKNVELFNEVIKLKKVLSNSELLPEKQETSQSKSPAKITPETSSEEQEIIRKLREEVGQYKAMLADLESKYAQKEKELTHSMREIETRRKDDSDAEIASKLAASDASISKYEEENLLLKAQLKDANAANSKFENDKLSLVSQLQDVTAKLSSCSNDADDKSKQIEKLREEIKQALLEKNATSTDAPASTQQESKESVEIAELQARCDTLSSVNSDLESTLQKHREVLQAKEQQYALSTEECTRYKEDVKRLTVENEESKQSARLNLERLEQAEVQLRIASVTAGSTDSASTNDSKLALLSQELEGAFVQITALKANLATAESDFKGKIGDLESAHEEKVKAMNKEVAQIRGNLAGAQLTAEQKDNELAAMKKAREDAESVVQQSDNELAAMKKAREDAESMVQQRDNELAAMKKARSDAESVVQQTHNELAVVQKAGSDAESMMQQRDNELVLMKKAREDAESMVRQREDEIAIISSSNDANVKYIKKLESDLTARSTSQADTTELQSQIASLTEKNAELVDKYNKLHAKHAKCATTIEALKLQSQSMTPEPSTPKGGRPSGIFNQSNTPSKRASYVSPSQRQHFSSEAEVIAIRNQAATLIQSKVRGANARERLRSRISNEKAQADGVLLAMPGTLQGQTGWYKGKDKIFYFCLYKGEYLLLCGPITEDSYHSMLHEMQQETLKLRPSSDQQALPKRYLAKDIPIDKFAVFATKRQIEQLVQENKELKKKAEDPHLVNKISLLEKQNQVQKDEIKRLLGTNDQLLKNIDSLQSTFYKTGKQSNDTVAITERPLMTRQVPLGRHPTIIVDALHTDQSLLLHAVKLAGKLQKIARGFIGRKKTQAIRRTIIARKAGVLLAMKKTVQGQDGWYEDPQGKIFYFVPHRGQWTVAAGPIRKAEFETVWMNRRVVREGVEVLKQVKFNLRFVHEHIKGETYISSESGKMFIAVPVDLIIKQSHIIEVE